MILIGWLYLNNEVPTVRPKSPSDRGTGPIERPQKPLSKPLFIGSVVVTLVCVLAFIGLVLRGLQTEEFGYAPHLLILLVFAIAVTASLAITEIIPWRATSVRDWQRPKVVGSVVALIVGALGLVADLTGIFTPSAATEKTLSDVRKQLEDAGITRGDASRIEQHINGTWGEPACQVTYDLTLGKGQLTIASKKSVPGQNPLSMELAAEPGTGSRLVASVMKPLQERGDAHEFLYEKVGTREFLTWVIKKREISLKLDRCQQG